MIDIAVHDPYIPCGNMQNYTLDDVDSAVFTKIYCSCGRFVDMDRDVLMMKQRLHKPLECSHCRNRRIAKEIEMMEEEALSENESICA